MSYSKVYVIREVDVSYFRLAKLYSFDRFDTYYYSTGQFIMDFFEKKN